MASAIRAAVVERGAPVTTPALVYHAISEVTRRLAALGIGKTRKNEQQHYIFRGIDDVYNALAPILPDAHLVILPRMLSRSSVERTSRSGTLQFFVVVEAEFDFVSTEDASVHVIRTYGEAQDTADKATNKAMSAAFKYACLQAFCIPTEGDNDADATTPEPSVATATPAEPKGYAEWALDFEAVADEGLTALRKAFKDAAMAHPEWTAHLQVHDQARYERIKAKARAVREPSA